MSEAVAFHHACKVWERYITLKMLMKEDPGPEFNGAWKRHADKARAAAKEFVHALIRVACVSNCQVVYLDHVHVHSPKFIEMLGRLIPYAAQGVEYMHQRAHKNPPVKRQHA
eukprot:jgi/Tetstr1/462997/TSEL_007936.t1